MKEIKLTQGYVAIVDDEDYKRMQSITWRAFKKKSENTAYARGKIKIGGQVKDIFMHRYIMKLMIGDIKQIDHINSNGLDNRKENLRCCSTSQNGMNRLPDKNTTSKYKGVSWASRDKVWQVSIACNKKQQYLGRFKSETEAAKVYNNKAVELFGEFARLNQLPKETS